MNTCQTCQHYEFILDDMDEIVSESCAAPLPVFVEAALRYLYIDPKERWDSSTAGEFCKAFEEAA